MESDSIFLEVTKHRVYILAWLTQKSHRIRDPKGMVRKNKRSTPQTTKPSAISLLNPSTPMVLVVLQGFCFGVLGIVLAGLGALAQMEGHDEPCKVCFPQKDRV